MKTVVQKFGGTSVGSAERLHKVSEIITESRKTCYPVVVVSAMSGTLKTEGTTSLLLSACQQAEQGQAFDATVEQVRQNHLKAIETSIASAENRKEVSDFLQAEISALTNVLGAIKTIHEASPRSRDLVIGLGERLSARVLTAVLQEHELPAKFIDLSQALRELDISTLDVDALVKIQTALALACTPPESTIPVVTGFFGPLPGGILSAVGRGYSDFAAALLAAGMGPSRVSELQIWKEVDGVFTSDPRKVPSATVLDSLSGAEAAEITYFGSEVLHPFTMERVMSVGIPVRVKNTFKPWLPGTLIQPEGSNQSRRITAVTGKRGISIFLIRSNRMYNASGFMAKVFDVLRRHEIGVDLISTSEVSVSCTVEQYEDMQRALPELETFGEVKLTSGFAILSVVGEGIRHHTDVPARIFLALSNASIQVQMITQASTRINVSCVIGEAELENGLRAVHQEFA